MFLISFLHVLRPTVLEDDITVSFCEAEVLNMNIQQLSYILEFMIRAMFPSQMAWYPTWGIRCLHKVTWTRIICVYNAKWFQTIWEVCSNKLFQGIHEVTTWSARTNYKHHNTCKFHIEITPQGSTCIPLGGWVSDIHLDKRNKIGTVLTDVKWSNMFIRKLDYFIEHLWNWLETCKHERNARRRQFVKADWVIIDNWKVM